MIGNLEERMFRLEETMKDIVDFMKEERLRRAEKEKQKKKEEDEVKVVPYDDGIKEVLLDTTTLEQVSINTGEVMIPDDVAIVEKENLNKDNQEKEEEKIKKLFVKKKNNSDESAGVKNDNHDEYGQEKE
ncbi:hypothetical protein FXO37_11737 [Capsicum annuum]|nr:hypothetical protein FXO37_11737 [Capsicum annuum]